MPATMQPKLLLSGPNAVSAAAKLMLTARPVRVSSSFGPVDLVPGAIWQRDKMLVDCGEMVVHYLAGAQLYEWSTQIMVRDTWLTGLQHGAARARWLIHVAKVERDLLFGMFVPVYGMIGLMCARILVVYSNHRPAFATIQKYYGPIMTDLKIVKTECPVLFGKVFEKVALEVVGDIKDGVSAEDIAFWLGRIYMGVMALPRAGMMDVPNITAAGLFKVLRTVTLLVGLLHAPGMAIRGTKAAIEQADIDKVLKELQQVVTPAEGVQIALELQNAKQSKAALERLKTNITAVKPSCDEVFEAWEKAS